MSSRGAERCPACRTASRQCMPPCPYRAQQRGSFAAMRRRRGLRRTAGNRLVRGRSTVRCIVTLIADLRGGHSIRDGCGVVCAVARCLSIRRNAVERRRPSSSLTDPRPLPAGGLHAVESGRVGRACAIFDALSGGGVYASGAISASGTMTKLRSAWGCGTCNSGEWISRRRSEGGCRESIGRGDQRGAGRRPTSCSICLRRRSNASGSGAVAISQAALR